MSLTQKERQNPPPRQKSCAACIKAKRRCDAAQPACLRCAQRGIPCVMPARRPQQRAARSSAAAAAATPITAVAAPPTPPSTHDLNEFMDTTFPFPQATCVSDWECPLSSLDPMLAYRDVDYSNPTPSGMTTATTDELSTDAQHGGFLPRSLEAGHRELLELILQPSTMSAPTSRPLDKVPDAMSQRLSYALAEIKHAPSMMVLQTQTPWCHPKLYEEEMPRSMQDAHASCALYMAKNRANAPVILRSIETRVNDLINSPFPTTPLGILARVQSLILYHIIRVFDGDIAARASAERTQSALEDASMSLILHTDFDCPSPSKLAAKSQQLPLYPLSPTKRFWQEWVFQESARRTLLFTFFFLQAYRVISGQRVEACDGRLNRCHAFTLSASLWEADGPLAFARAWAEKRHLVVENTDFQIAFREARPDDVDAFGKIMLTSLIGVDEAEGWFAARGGSLREAAAAS